MPKLSELRQFVSSSPKNRLYCTLVQHFNGPETTPPVCYVLYMEYLGGLVPLLKGKRISMLKPEFVIFDPQVDGKYKIFFYFSSEHLLMDTIIFNY